MLPNSGITVNKCGNNIEIAIRQCKEQGGIYDYTSCTCILPKKNTTITCKSGDQLIGSVCLPIQTQYAIENNQCTVVPQGYTGTTYGTLASCQSALNTRTAPTATTTTTPPATNGISTEDIIILVAVAVMSIIIVVVIAR